MDTNYASLLQGIILHDNAYMEYLPDPVIPHHDLAHAAATHPALQTENC
jgi:urease accessory protein UreH